MAKKLTDKHPTDKKFRLLEDFMREHRISIDYAYGFIFNDEENNVSTKIKSEDGQMAYCVPENWAGSYLIIEE